jgi:hypothetical protein
MRKPLLFSIFILALAGLAVSQNNPAAGIPYLGKRSGDPTCNASRKGFTYYNTTTNIYRFCNGSTWADVGGGGITVGTTTSNGTANTLLKTNGSGAVADATGVTNANGSPLTVTSQMATDVPITIIGAASQSGDLLQVKNSGGTLLGGINASGYFIGRNADKTRIQNTLIGTVGLDFDGGNARYVFFQDSNNNATFDGSNFRLASGRQFAWSSNSSDSNTSADTGMNRVAAKVISATDGSTSAAGWLQDAGHKRVATNATNATATVAALSDLTFNVQAGRKYAGEFSFIAKNSTAAEGLQFDFNGGSAVVTSVQFLFRSTPQGTTLGTTQSTALGAAITATTATTGDVVYTIFFTVVVNTGGTLVPRFAEVSHTSGTATVEAGSVGFIYDIP